MNAIGKCCRLLPAVLLLGIGACGTDTITKTEIVFPDCSPTAPQGKCAAGQTCFGGACVASDTLCSPTNLAGTCAAGLTCFAGGCILEAELCGSANPDGLCVENKTCFNGACVDDTTLCSATNTTGSCAAGSTCFGGGCLLDSVFCSGSNPVGICASGKECFSGACVASANMCSPTNLTGTCPAGTACIEGGCLVTDALCGTANQTGICADADKACLEGTCVFRASLCSAANLTGACAENLTCFGGGCVLEASLCGEANPTGPCANGFSCLEGTCVATNSLCTAANPEGTCGAGLTCQDGMCAAPGVDPCTVPVYSEQPVVTVRTEITGRASATATLNAVVAGNTIRVGDTTFTAVAATATPTEIQFALGADDIATAANIATAINANAVSKLLVNAVAAEKVVTLTALANGAAGNGIVTSGTATRFTLSSAALKGGAGTGKALITVDGKQFRDLSADGALDPYEDWRLSPICRAKDLVKKMTVPQKVGLMSESSGLGGGTVDGSIGSARGVVTGFVRQALIRLSSISPTQLAVYTNNVQELAESQPLGIPVVFTADPVHFLAMSTNGTSGAQSLALPIVSSWPLPAGLGASQDVSLTRKYGNTVRREFMAMGFRWQLGPMADTGTEPRWDRINNLFGESALAVAGHVRANIEGFQGSATGDLRNGIAATVKHFPGAGANQDGMDSHSYPGRYSVYPGNNFAYHLLPFQVAFDVGAASIMPCYSIFKDQTQWDPMGVAPAFSYGLITDLAKQRMGFTGMVTGDWGTLGHQYGATSSLSLPERAALWLHAGSHQLGSDSASNFQLAYDQGLVTEADINEAAAKILEMSFKLGIFENPYVDPTLAATVVKGAETSIDGFNAQKRAIVMLRNNGSRLPISGARTQADANGDGTVKVFFDGVTDALAGTDELSTFLGDYDYRSAADATVTPAVKAVEAAADLASADIAVLRIVSRKGNYSGWDAGVPLSFDGVFPGTSTDSNVAAAIKDRNRVIDAFRVRDGYTKSDGTVVPAANANLKIVLVMHAWRPGIVKPFINGLKTLDETSGTPGSYPIVSNEANVNQTIVTTSTPTAKAGVDAFLVEYGALDRAVLDFVFNKNVPPGVTGHGRARLPVELPSTDAEVDAQFEDVPYDTKAPTYANGAGSNL